MKAFGRRWRWPILGALRSALRWARRNWRDGELLGFAAVVWGGWFVAIGLLSLVLSAAFWVVPHTNDIQIWGAHPRPGFWILVAGAAPEALVIAWAALAWVLPTVLKAFLLLVPRPEPPPRLPLKAPEEIAAMERDLGIGDDR